MPKRAKVQLTNAKKVTTSWTSKEIRRESPGGVLEPSGLFRANVAATELLIQYAIAQGLDPNRVRVELEADAIARAVGVRPTAETGPGIQSVRRFKGGDSSFHLGGVFAEHPDLRPNAKQTCDIDEGVDAEGNDLLVILLGPSVEKVKGRNRRRRSTREAGAGTADEKKEPAPEPSGAARAEAVPAPGDKEAEAVDEKGALEKEEEA